MFKITLKSVAIAMSVLAAVVMLLTFVDGARNVSVTAKTYIKVAVVDLDGEPVHNARVTVGDNCFFTDNKGLSPSIEIGNISNCYDSSIVDWGTVTVQVAKASYVPAFVFNCVVYRQETRRLTVKIYPLDSTELSYVSYVESPPDDYIKGLLK